MRVIGLYDNMSNFFLFIVDRIIKFRSFIMLGRAIYYIWMG